MATLEEMTSEVLGVLGQVPGIGTQMFSEDNILEDLVRMFNICFTKYPWPHFREWFRFALDETTGTIDDSEGFENVRGIEDFLSIHRDAEANPLPVMPKGLNPYTLSGTKARFWTFLPSTDADYVVKRLKFYPAAAEGYVNVNARVYPRTLGQAWVWDDDMALDKDMLVYGAAWLRLLADGTNPEAAEANKSLFELRFKDITGALSQLMQSTGAGDASIPTEWYVRP